MQPFLSFKTPKAVRWARKLFSFLVLIPFVCSLIVVPARAQSLPMPSVTAVFQPPLLVGLKIHPENPLLFDFIIDQGASNLSEDQFKLETEKLVKYFLAALTIPDNEVWVNLSPYEKDRIIPDVLGQTGMGKTMLEQDFILKQLASSLTNPNEKLGSEFWSKVKADADQSGVEASTLSKVWIVPSKAEVLESQGIVLVGEKRLKVMMAEEYENGKKGTAISKGSAIFRDLILPGIEKEVNEGKSFADVRQIYNSVILAAWYKQALKESLLGQVYADQGKILGIETDDKAMKQRIYEQYLAAFKKGVYNLIKEEADSVTGEMIPRKYFSGGIMMAKFAASSALSVERVSPAVMKQNLRASSSLKTARTMLAENTEWQLTGSSAVEETAGAGTSVQSQASPKTVTVLTLEEAALLEKINDMKKISNDALEDYLINLNPVKSIMAANIVLKQEDFAQFVTVSVWRDFHFAVNDEFRASNAFHLSLKYFKRTLPTGTEVSIAEVQDLASEITKTLKSLQDEQVNRSIYKSDAFVQKMAEWEEYGAVVQGILDAKFRRPFEVMDQKGISIKKLKGMVPALRNEMNDLLEIKQLRDLPREKVVAQLVVSLKDFAARENRLPSTAGLVADEMVDVVRQFDASKQEPLVITSLAQAIAANLASPEPLGVSTDLYKAFVARLSLLKPEQEQEAFLGSFFPDTKKQAALDPTQVRSILKALIGDEVKAPAEDQIASSPVGGIDFNPAQMNLQIKRDGRGVPLPLPKQDLKSINIEGLHPVIIEIMPVNPQTLPLVLAQN